MPTVLHALYNDSGIHLHIIIECAGAGIKMGRGVTIVGEAGIKVTEWHTLHPMFMKQLIVLEKEEMILEDQYLIN